ncbi:MAG: TIR domain-containing protein, partial [Gammaproteobacteria bacterium]|nr:TIR domain-containing protein [Gammaproteobacteria bacterium]
MTDNGTITEESRRYDAFLSYSHSDDTALAADLVATLETIAKPWYRRRALRVFRDKSSLAATAALWSSLRRSLDQSEFLVLLATPAAAKSEGVQREICHWLKTRSSDTILIALAEGTIEWDESVGDFDWERTAALPWELKGSFAEEPLHADLRAFRLQSAARRKNPEFLNAVGDLAAPIRKISKDELLGEQLRQHRRTMRIAWSAAGIFAALTVAVTIASVIAVQQRNEAILQSELSRSRELAAASRALIDQDRRRSIQLALDSLDTADTAEAYEGLLRGMIASHNIIALIGGTTAAAVFDPADRVYWAQGNKIFTWNLDCSEPQSTVATLAFEPERLLVGEDGTRLLAVDGGTFALIAMPGGEVLQQETEPRRAVFDEAVMSDSVFAVAHNVNTVSVWRAADGTQIGTTLRGPLGPVSAMALSSDSRLLATADEAMARRVLLWKIQDDAPEATEVAGVADSVGGLAFIGPDRLLVGTDKLVVYDVSDPRNPIVAFDMSVARRITALAARADGRFVTGHSDGTVIVWQREPDDSLTRLQSYEHDTEIRRVAAPPGTEIFIAVGGATWRMIHPGSPETLLGPSSSGRAAIADLTTSRDGRVLATVDTDGRLSVWRSAIPPLVGHDIEYATAKSMLLSARMNEVLRWTN